MELWQRVAIQRGALDSKLRGGGHRRGAKGRRHSGLSAYRRAQARPYSHMEWPSVGLGLSAAQHHSPLRLLEQECRVDHISTSKLTILLQKKSAN